MYKIYAYEVINGHKIQSREKQKIVPTINDIDALQKRAQRIWNLHRKERDKLTVYLHYIHLHWQNLQSDNIGQEGFVLKTWM